MLRSAICREQRDLPAHWRYVGREDAMAWDFQTDPEFRHRTRADWPHAEGTPAPADFLAESLGKLPEADMRQIARDNALELLGISLG
jgi:hypothetical protein